MITCRRCGSEMEKIYNFGNDESYQNYRCSNCGNTTKGKEIEFDDESGEMLVGKVKTNIISKARQHNSEDSYWFFDLPGRK